MADPCRARTPFPVLIGALLVMVVMVTVGCTTTPDAAPPSTGAARVTAPAPGPAPTPPTSSTPNTTRAFPPLPAPALEILRADGLGSIDFGGAADPSLLTLGDVFRSNRTTGTRMCGATPARTVTWPELEVRFVDERFVGYEYRQSSSKAPTARIYRTTEGIGLGSTTAELRAAYGDRLVVTADAATGFTWSTGAPPAFTGRLSGPPDAPDSTVVAITAGPICT